MMTLSLPWQVDLNFGFSQSLFWDYVLPPIIFNAGYSMKRRQFFNNFSTIAMYGVRIAIVFSRWTQSRIHFPFV